MNVRRTIRSYVLLLISAFCMAVNFQLLIFGNEFAPSGLHGIATMIQYRWGVPVGISTLIMNLPLCLAAQFLVDREYVVKSLFFSLFFSVFLLAVEKMDLSAFQYQTPFSALLAPIAAGVVDGALYGLALRQNGSTGGTDILAACVRAARPHWNLVWIIFALNCAVAGASYFVYGYRLEPVILCILYSFVTGRISDGILRGGNALLKVEIVTPESLDLSREIMEKLGHGVTSLFARGMYSGKDNQMLVCVITKHKLARLRGILSSHPGTFSYVSPVNEIYGYFDA